ncbi:MAG TPA: hypothetical protein VJY39_15400 [Acidisphaera sp.]|nr:hypothetical protein [Acidisphaera sp.]
MRLTQVLATAGLAGLVAGCMTQASLPPVTPEVQATMLDDLRAGRMTLDCGAACSATWTAQLGAIRAFDAADHYADLAVRVMQVRYGSDLAYYYLGRAAQGLGDYTAAIAYYQHALDLANGTDPVLRCEAVSAACQGVDLAGTLPVLIQASQRELAESTPHTTVRRRPAHAAPATAGPGWATPPPPTETTAGAAASGGSGWVAPPPAASAPSTSGTTSGGAGWVAPPPPSH